MRYESVPNGLHWLRPTLIAFDDGTIALALICALLAYRNWRLSCDEFDGSAGELVELGEGRTRFLALWGLLVSILICVAAAFDLSFLLVVPLCG